MRSNAVLANERFAEEAAIEVRDKDGHKGVFAKERILADAVVFYLKGAVLTVPTKYTIELSRHRHLTIRTRRKTGDDLDYCWKYLNHSCEPNGYINTVDRTFCALRAIACGEELTFNYLTTESEMAVPFTCNCGSANCFGFIQGRAFLTTEQADKLAFIMGKDNVVTLFMPVGQSSFGRRKNI